MGAFGQDQGGVLGLQADELFAAGARRIGAPERAPAQEVLLRTDDPVHAEVGGGHRAVGFLADDDVALLGAQHVHGLGAERRDAVFLAGVHERRPQTEAVARRHVDLERQLAREADPEDARRDAADGRGAPRHEGKGLAAEVDAAGELGEQPPRVGPTKRDRRPLFGGRGGIHLELRPFRLQPFLEPGEDARRVAGGRGHQVVVGAKARRDPVVHHHAVLAQHQAVTAAPHLQLAPGVGVYPVEQLGGVRPLDVDLAQGRGVHDADRGARRQALAVDGAGHVLAGAPVVPRALPLADVLEAGAGALVPVVHGGAPHDVRQRAHVAPGERPEGDRRVGWAEGGVTVGGDVGAAEAGQDGEAGDVGGLALVGAHAERRVALQVLDRGIAFARRQRDVGRRHVVLQIDEVLGAALGVAGRRHRLVGAGRLLRSDGGPRCLGGASAGPEPGARRGIGARRPALGQTAVEGQGAVGGAGRTRRLGGRRRHEAGMGGVEAQPPARLGKQVGRRVPAARHAQQVARDAPRRARDVPAVVAKRHHLDRRQALAPVGRHHAMAGDEFDVGALGLRRQVAGGLAAGVDDGGDLDARRPQVEGGAVGAVVVGEQDGAAPRLGCVSIGVGARRVGQHDAGAVVAGEDQGALDGAGGQHHLLGADAPQALARQVPGAARAQMVGDALQRRQEIVVVVAEDRGARQTPHLVHGVQLGGGLGGPVHGRGAVDLVIAGQQGAAQLVLLVGQDDPRARTPGGQRRRQPGRPAADHQHVAVDVHLVIAVGVGAVRGAAQAGGAADHRFVGHPQGGRPLEGLVVEAGGHEAREQAERRGEVVIDARPAIDAGGGEAVVELDAGGAGVGQGVGAALHLDDGVGLLRSRREDAAWTVVLEAAPDHRDPVGDQRRGQGVAGVALVVAAVEGEAQRPAAFDAPALGQPVGLFLHDASPGGFSPTL